MTSALNIRRPRPDEAEALADLHLRSWEETYAGQFPPSAWGADARAQRIRMWTAICTEARPEWLTAVAEMDGEVVGIAHSGASDDDTGRLLWLIYVLKSAQGSGAGQALLDAVIGDEPATLWVLEENPRARAFYERNGFRADGERKPTGFDAGGDEIRMVRP